MARIHNFSAGPAVLPESVLLEAREALWEYGAVGMGIMEFSHRSKAYEALIASARGRLRRLLRVGDDHEILFLSGGASSQFFMAPMNFLLGGRAAYLETGHWAEKAVAEARRFGSVDTVWSSRASGFDHVPRPGSWPSLAAETRYLHYTSNNTIYGTQFDHVPDSGSAWLFCDASSDILSRPIEGSKFDLLYAGAQKNLGPSGVTVVALRKARLADADPNLPTMLRYGVHAENGSMYNTPNTWGIYLLERVCAWIEERGLDQVAADNARRAGQLYARIDATGFWRGTCRRDSRSMMNVTFTTGNAELDTQFYQEAERSGMSGLKGHRAVGGLRASLYNAQTDAAVAALVSFMEAFEARHG
jgi:phosphoserine aminotransferase